MYYNIRMYRRIISTLIFVLSFSFSDKRVESILLHNDLIAFNSLIGKNFIGEIKSKVGSRFITEIVSWESALKGDAVKASHIFNDDELLGETLIMYDQLENDISCWYFSSGGISKKSKFLSKSNDIIFLEDVSRNNNSITKIRTTYKLNKNSSYQKVTQYLINNVWTKGEKVLYQVF